MTILKRLAARLPQRYQTELKRIFFARQINKGGFRSTEPEYKILQQLVNPNDWVIDIGANIGQYTKRFSELVGAQGRVIAFEPVPSTFALLASNVQLFTFSNVTLINAAVSDKLEVVGMSIPNFANGLSNYYEAHVSSVTDSALTVITLPLDSFSISQQIALIKIDAEGHEACVLAGMQRLLSEHHPILIVETKSKEVIDMLSALDYVPEKLENSPNVLFRPNVKD